MPKNNTTAKEKPAAVPPEIPEEQEEPLVLGPAVLGLHPVGAAPPPKPPPKQPIQVINSRGMPSRIRKRNKLFFNDDTINDPNAMENEAPPKKPSKRSAPEKPPVKKRKIRGRVAAKTKKRKGGEKKDKQKRTSKIPKPGGKKPGRPKKKAR